MILKQDFVRRRGEMSHPLVARASPRAAVVEAARWPALAELLVLVLALKVNH
jgi:hypothetical protein